MTPGILHPSTYNNPHGLQKDLERMAQVYRYELDYMETDAVRNVLDTEKYYQALRDPRLSILMPSSSV